MVEKISAFSFDKEELKELGMIPTGEAAKIDTKPMSSTDPLYAYLNNTMAKVTEDSLKRSAGKIAGEGASMSSTDANALAEIIKAIKVTDSVKGYNNSLQKVANDVYNKMISGESPISQVPSYFETMFKPLVDDIKATTALKPTDAIAAENAQFKLGFLQQSLINSIKSEIIATQEAITRNPAIVIGAENAIGNLGTAREFRLLETAVQYGNTVRVVFNKITPTEVYQDTIDIPFTREDTFVIWTDENGDEQRTNVLDYYTSPETMRKVANYMDGKRDIVIKDTDVSTNLGMIDLYQAPWSLPKDEAMVTQMYIAGVKVEDSNNAAVEVDLLSTKMSSDDDAYLLRAGDFNFFKKIKINKADESGKEDFVLSFAGRVDFSGRKLNIAFANPKIKEVKFRIFMANDMYNRSITFDKQQEVKNFTIKHIHRIDLVYNPRMIQIFNKIARTNLMNNLIARGSENISHHKELNYFDTLKEKFDAFHNIYDELTTAGDLVNLRKLAYLEETVNASYYQGQDFNTIIRGKIAVGLNQSYYGIKQRINNKAGFAYTSIIAPKLQSYLTNVIPVIRKEPIDTTVQGLFAGMPVDSPVISYSLENGDTPNGGLRGIAVASDKMWDFENMYIVPLIQDPNLINIMHVEMPTLIYSNNEIRPLRGRGINVHTEALFDTFAINPTLAKVTITNLMKAEVVQVQPVAGA